MNIFFWVRVLFSTALLSFALAVTLKSLIDGNSGMWEGVPVWASIVILRPYVRRGDGGYADCCFCSYQYAR